VICHFRVQDSRHVTHRSPHAALCFRNRIRQLNDAGAGGYYREGCLGKPGENRFAFGSAAQAKTSPCKVSSEDRAGGCTVFELNALPRSGPFLHVHHREDEWYYVLSGEFLFRAGSEEHNLLTGGSVWLPRGIPHVCANTAAANGKLILMCQLGGFEKFFDEIGKVPVDKKESRYYARAHGEIRHGNAGTANLYFLLDSTTFVITNRDSSLSLVLWTVDGLTGSNRIRCSAFWQQLTEFMAFSPIPLGELIERQLQALASLPVL